LASTKPITPTTKAGSRILRKTSPKPASPSLFSDGRSAGARVFQLSNKMTTAISSPKLATRTSTASRTRPRTADAQERRHEGADVDAHVEDVETRVALGVARLVEVADHHRDVGLEEAVADDEADEAAVRSTPCPGCSSGTGRWLMNTAPMSTARR
jgi:hypothetical protein